MTATEPTRTGPGIAAMPTAPTVVACYSVFDHFFPALGFTDLTDGMYEGEMRVAALHNGYHVALCNRVGQEDCLNFSGESFVCDPDGLVLARAPLGQDHVLFTDLDLAANERSTARRLFLRHRRPELYAAWLGR